MTEGLLNMGASVSTGVKAVRNGVAGQVKGHTQARKEPWFHWL